MYYLTSLIFNMFGARLKHLGYLSSMLLMTVLIYLSGYPNPVTTLDYANYAADYNGVSVVGYVSRFEWAYQFVANLGHKLSLDYADFRFFYVLGTMALLYLAVARLIRSDYVAFFWTGFSTFLFFIETIQLRSFTMVVFVLLGVSFLKSNSLKNVVFAYLFIILGIGFHSSGTIYLLVPLIFLIFNSKINHKFFSSLWIVAFLVTIFLWGIGTAVLTQVLGNWIGALTGNTAIQNNVATLYTDGGSFWSFIKIVLFSLFVLLVSKQYEDYDGLEKGIIGKALMSFMIVSLVGMPLMMVSSQYDRILRAGIMVGMILASMSIFRSNRISYAKVVYIVLLIAIIFFFLGGYVVSDFTPFSNMFNYMGFDVN